MEARAPFAAWSAAEPSELVFPAREFAYAVNKSGLGPEVAAPFVPPPQRHTLSSYYNNLLEPDFLEPDYNPWSY